MPKIPVEQLSVTPAWLSEALEAGPGVPETVVVKFPTLDITASESPRARSAVAALEDRDGFSLGPD